MSRVDGLDILRGFAILLMIIFHTSYDLNYFNYIDIKITKDPFWLNFRVLIVTLFLLAVGISLYLTHKDGIKWQKVKKRAFILAVASILVTVATYIVFPNEWVYFGILHSILVLSILALPFINRGYLSLLLAVAILIGYNFYNINMHPLFNLLQKPLNLPTNTVDLAPIIPWFSVVLVGLSIGSLNLYKRVFSLKLFKIDNNFTNLLKILGKNSLFVYIIHQPVIFGMLFLIKNI